MHPDSTSRSRRSSPRRSELLGTVNQPRSVLIPPRRSVLVGMRRSLCARRVGHLGSHGVLCDRADTISALEKCSPKYGCSFSAATYSMSAGESPLVVMPAMLDYPHDVTSLANGIDGRPLFESSEVGAGEIRRGQRRRVPDTRHLPLHLLDPPGTDDLRDQDGGLPGRRRNRRAAEAEADDGTEDRAAVAVAGARRGSPVRLRARRSALRTGQVHRQGREADAVGDERDQRRPRTGSRGSGSGSARSRTGCWKAEGRRRSR